MIHEVTITPSHKSEAASHLAWLERHGLIRVCDLDRCRGVWRRDEGIEWSSFPGGNELFVFRDGSELLYNAAASHIAIENVGRAILEEDLWAAINCRGRLRELLAEFTHLSIAQVGRLHPEIWTREEVELVRAWADGESDELPIRIMEYIEAIRHECGG